MRIEQLQYLDAIVTCGSMRRAGEKLHLSQPALSESIRNLEKELGVTLLDRRRSGARISASGRDLLPFLADVLDAVDRLRAAAGDQDRTSRTVRIGTVHAATVSIVAPAIRAFRAQHPDVPVEVRTSQQAEIREALLDGSLDLGLMNVMAGGHPGVEQPGLGQPGLGQPGDDELPDPDLRRTQLLRGSAVVCCRSDSALAALPEVGVAELAGEPFVYMRPGYVMHRFAHGLLGSHRPSVTFVADGAEMGKTMVAEGLGVTVLPDYSVAGDPLERAGVITYRRLAGVRDEDAAVALTLVTRPGEQRSAVLRQLEALLSEQAAALPALPVPPVPPVPPAATA